MYHFSIGVLLDSFRTDMETALKKAAKLGVSGVQIYATQGSMAPENLNALQRREVLDMIKSNGLVVSALCGDLGQGFGNAEKNPALIEKSKRILDLAKDLETDVVTTHIGVVPKDPSHPRYQIMQAACFELAQYADSVKAHFAIETGPETSLTLKDFLDGLHSTGVAVNLDPANLVMVTGDDPAQAVYNLKDYIVHTHAKDGKKLLERSPEIIYGIETPKDDLAQQGEAFIELPLGEGGVNWDKYLKALDDIGYHGFLTIEREVGENPEADIQKAVDFLNAHIKKS